MTNPRLIKFAKDCLKEDLSKCTESQQDLFKMIYGSLGIEMNSIIDDIPGDELDWAMNLVERTLSKD
jgi:hypothetical protein